MPLYHVVPEMLDEPDYKNEYFFGSEYHQLQQKKIWQCNVVLKKYIYQMVLGMILKRVKDLMVILGM